MKNVHVILLARKKIITSQQGLTLIEVMVALAISSVIALAAMASLFVARQGFSAVDTSAQLRDNARFAAAIMQRVTAQAGFLDSNYAMQAGPSDFKIAGTTVNPEPTIRGFDNAAYNQSLVLGLTSSTTPSYNNSDMLVVRYQTGSREDATTGADKTMISCAGFRSALIPITKDDRLMSVFHVQLDATTNEPSLMCTYLNDTTGVYTTQPLVQGVESMQILYGVDGVVPGAATVAAETSIPTRYLKASDLTVPSNAIATNQNWARVRTVKIAMILRGPPGSSSQKDTPALAFFGASSSGPTASDPALTFPAQTDRRLRQVLNFSVELRNSTKV